MVWRGPIDRLNTISLGIEQEVRRLTQPPAAVSMAEQMRRLEEQVRPAPEQIDHFMKRLELVNVDTTEKLARLTTVPAELANLPRDLGAGELLRVERNTQKLHDLIELRDQSLERCSRQLADFGRFQSHVANRLASFPASAYLTHLEELSSLERRLQKAADQMVAAPLDQLADFLSPCLALLSEYRLEGATGILTAFTDSSLRGLLSWKRHEATDYGWALGTAALLGSEVSTAESIKRGKQVEIRCRVFCVLCGSHFVVMEKYCELWSDTEIEVTLAIFPLCPTCVKESGESQQYWRDSLAEMAEPTRPRYRLIQGKGEGNGRPDEHAHLWLVVEEDDSPRE